MGDELVGSDGCAGHDDGMDRFAPLRVGDGEHVGLKHCRVAVEGIFDFGAVHVLTAGHDHVFGPVDEEDEPLVVLIAQVAGAVPAVDERGRGLGRLVPLADHDVGGHPREVQGPPARRRAGGTGPTSGRR